MASSRSRTPRDSRALNAHRAQGGAQPTDRRIRRSLREKEAKRQRLAIIVGVAIILAVVVIVAVGYYQSFIAPPRVVALKVRDTVYTQGDLVNRIRLIRDAQGGAIDLSTAPLETLFNMVDAELIRQGADFEGVVVDDEDVEEFLKVRFYPFVPEGQEVEPGQVEREYKEAYRAFLADTRVSDKDYRVLAEDVIYRARLREALGERIPPVLEHVEVNWIRIPFDIGVDPNNPPPEPAEVLERLKAEEFSQVAGEVSNDPFFDGDGDGYIGWVPKGAFPQLDLVLFGDEDIAPIPLNQISDPETMDEAIYIVKVVGGPEVREPEGLTLEKLKDVTLDTWINTQRVIGIDQGWMEINFDSKLYAWVTEQLTQDAAFAPAAP